MRRRTVLQTLGGMSLASLAGCAELRVFRNHATPELDCEATYGFWPTQGANPQRTHVAGPEARLPGADAEVSQLTGRSTDAINGGVTSPPAVTADGVYLATTTGKVAQVGGEWSTELPGQATASPTAACESVYVTTGGTTHRFDPANGHERWQADPESIASPAVVESSVFVGDFGGLVALDAQTGDVQWTHEYGGADTSRGVAATTEYVVVTTRGENGNTGFLRCFSTDGEPRWKREIGHLFSTPAIRDGRVYAGNQAGTLWAFDLATGEERWRTSLEPEIETGLAVTDRSVFVPGGADGNMYAVAPESGDVQWKQHVGISAGAPAVVGTELAVPGDDIPGTATDGGLPVGIAIVDARSGEITHTYDLPGLNSGLAIGPGVIYFANGADDTLYALS